MSTGFRGTRNGSVQTGYFDNFSEGYPGQIAALPDQLLIDSFPAETSVAVGIAVVRGVDLTNTAGVYNNHTAPNKVKTPIAASVEADFEGITIRDSSTPTSATGDPIYEADDLAPVMRKGRVFVAANVAIAPRDPVWMIVQDTTVHGFEIGSFVNADLGGGDTVQLTEASFWKAASVGDVAIIELGR